MRLVDDLGTSTSTVTANLHVVEDGQGTGCADFPRMFSQSQNVTEVTPGTNINYSFQCDDVDTDVFSSDDDCDKAQIRWRRLDDGTTGGDQTMTGIDDNTTRSYNVGPLAGLLRRRGAARQRERQLPGHRRHHQGWWRVGNAVVNDGASTLSGSILSRAPPSSPLSVNPGPP